MPTLGQALSGQHNNEGVIQLINGFLDSHAIDQSVMYIEWNLS